MHMRAEEEEFHGLLYNFAIRNHAKMCLRFSYAE